MRQELRAAADLSMLSTPAVPVGAPSATTADDAELAHASSRPVQINEEIQLPRAAQPPAGLKSGSAAKMMEEAVQQVILNPETLPKITKEWLRGAIHQRWGQGNKGKPRLKLRTDVFTYGEDKVPVQFTEFFAAVAKHGGFNKVLSQSCLYHCSSDRTLQTNLTETLHEDRCGAQ
jgi:hypothetical protein